MNITTVQKLVEEIRAVAGDDEVAHIKEDELYEAVLIAISKSGDSDHDWAASIAKEALKTCDIDFARWHA